MRRRERLIQEAGAIAVDFDLEVLGQSDHDEFRRHGCSARTQQRGIALGSARRWDARVVPAVFYD